MAKIIVRSVIPVLLLSGLCFLFSVSSLQAQNDTVQTFTFGNASRSEVFTFPNVPNKTYEKIKMLYRMRCKNGLVSTSANRNLGCGEWDYSCNTYLTDSSSLDSLKATHASYLINGFSGTTFNYSINPTHDYYEYILKNTSYTGTSVDTTSTVLSGTANIPEPISISKTNSKTQLLWTAAELSASGLTVGLIKAVDFDLAQIGGIVTFFRIKLKPTAKTAINTIEDSTGFKQVYFQHTSFEAVGNKRFRFSTPYFWDGTSNIILELNYSSPTNSIGHVLKGGTTSFVSAISNLANDHFLSFDGAESHVDCGDIDALDNSSKFTLEAWVNIKSWQNWTNIFSDNGRVVLQTGANVGQLYCIIRNPTNTHGNVASVLPLNTWTHVAMVYDGSQPTNVGRLKLFINGVQKTLTFTGNIPATTEDNSTPLLLAKGLNSRIDDPRVWSVPLSATDIQSWMRKKVDTSHPFYASLQSSFGMDEGGGVLLSDISTFNRTGKIMGNTQWEIFKGNQILKNLAPISGRPNITWVKNGYTVVIDNDTVLDSIPNLTKTVIQYQLIGGLPIPVDTSALYQAGNQNVYSENGLVIRTIPAAVSGSLAINTLNYYRKFPQKFEIMSFVTPYGIGIDFGMQGKVWEFDVTDFVNQLKGNKRISLERGGENQEQMDIKFVFIEGTPPRKVLSLQQIWPVTQSTYADINSDKVFEPRSISMLPQSAHFKVRSVVTGHGQNGEFIPKSHNINLNGGTPEFQWDVWTGCSLNPIYPQGGTWVYDRAGWCPGAPSDVQEWNANQYLQAGQSATFDYGVSPATGDTRYIANHQLVQYGPALFELDASIKQVSAPSDLSEFGRRNPACMNPRIQIQNNGSTALTSLTISYGLEGGTMNTHQWTGNLAFLSSEEIILNVPNLGSSQAKFVVSCSNPNGGTDQYAPNNSIKSKYAAPMNVPAKFVIELKSNLVPGDNEFQLLDATGTVVLFRNNLNSNTIYRDTVELAEGCYEFSLTDAGNDGLAWWANTAQGTGYIRFRSATSSAILRTFNPDFGGEVYQQFIVNPTTSTSKQLAGITDLQVYPNPTSGKLTVDFGLKNMGEASIEIVDVLGKSQFLKLLQNASNEIMDIDVSHLPTGTYMAILKTATEVKVVRFIKS